MTIDEETSIDEKLANYRDYDVDIEDISKKKTKVIKKISIGTSSKDLVLSHQKEGCVLQLFCRYLSYHA